MYMLQALAGSVPTGDESNIGVWMIVGVVALVLVVICGVLSVISKKK